jgi:RNA polymerase sigma-70 factor (ECF subfamily)
VASAEDELLRSTGRAGALALLETLAADQREVVSLRVIADLSLEQTAIVMKKSTGAVKQLQRRALLNLRDQLEQKAWERT